MRLWSIHPKFLDKSGLVAVWREGLLAKKVLEGKTKGYKNHPQLERFKNTENPLFYINIYLNEIFIEASFRDYKFDYSKIGSTIFDDLFKYQGKMLTVTVEQIAYEINHLLNKLEIRDKKAYNKLSEKVFLTESLMNNFVNPMFELIEGPVEKWEKVT